MVKTDAPSPKSGYPGLLMALSYKQNRQSTTLQIACKYGTQNVNLKICHLMDFVSNRLQHPKITSVGFFFFNYKVCPHQHWGGSPG